MKKSENKESVPDYFGRDGEVKDMNISSIT